jgi:hypothetical protein
MALATPSSGVQGANGCGSAVDLARQAFVDALRMRMAATPAVYQDRLGLATGDEAIRPALETYVGALRRADVPPERVILRVKDGITFATALAMPKLWDPERMTGAIVTWAIEAYYEPHN